MLDFYLQGKISLEKVVEKMAHAPADCFKVRERGYIREGYWADLVLVDLQKPFTVTKDSLQYRCGWSPFEGKTFGSTVMKTFVSGELKYDNGDFFFDEPGRRLTFNLR